MNFEECFGKIAAQNGGPNSELDSAPGDNVVDGELKLMAYDFIPNDVWNRVTDFCREGPDRAEHKEKAVAKLAMVCKSMHGFFQEKRSALKLVLDGSFDVLMVKVQDNPAVLLQSQTARDHLGREYNCTPHEAMLKLNRYVMLKSVIPLIRQLDNGHELLQEQFFNTFSAHHSDPSRLTVKEHMDYVVWREDLRLKVETFVFTEITQAFKTANANEAKAILEMPDINTGSGLYYALDKFRNDFHDKAIRSLNANPYHLSRALDIYASDDFSGLSHYHYALFQSKVIDYVQAYLPARSYWRDADFTTHTTPVRLILVSLSLIAGLLGYHWDEHRVGASWSAFLYDISIITDMNIHHLYYLEEDEKLRPTL